jgi:TRAP-type C4-dicarboxylate transport system permease small subunit
MGVIGAAVGGLGRLLMVPAGIALILMMLHVNADVIGRLLLNHPIPVTIEVVSYYYMVAVIFLPLAAVERADHHIAVDILSQHFRGALRRWTLALAALASMAYFAVLAWRSGIVAVEKLRIGEYEMGAVALPTWPSRLLVPIGTAAIAAVLLVKAIELLRGREPAKPLPVVEEIVA